ncbi:MAG: hypothetical protein H3C62_02400 [Gemmatimonadaceae bacterium]|nr:hypothetical protein [Gemmatimonadaceae bacterium]
MSTSAPTRYVAPLPDVREVEAAIDECLLAYVAQREDADEYRRAPFTEGYRYYLTKRAALIALLRRDPPIAPGHPEALCVDCRGPNASWYAATALWNQIVRPQGENGPDPMLCPRCFALRAFAAGMDVTWEMRPAGAELVPVGMEEDIAFLAEELPKARTFGGSVTLSSHRVARILNALEILTARQRETMTERPGSFSGPMVSASLDGRGRTTMRTLEER